MDQAHREWIAWRFMCDELKKLGVDINGQDELCEAIKKWGEELAVLRKVER